MLLKTSKLVLNPFWNETLQLFIVYFISHSHHRFWGGVSPALSVFGAATASPCLWEPRQGGGAASPHPKNHPQGGPARKHGWEVFTAPAAGTVADWTPGCKGRCNINTNTNLHQVSYGNLKCKPIFKPIQASKQQHQSTQGRGGGGGGGGRLGE